MADNNIYEDIISRAESFDVTEPILPQHRILHRDIERLTQIEYQNATLAAVDEIITISSGDRTGGTFDLDFTLADGTTFSANGLAFNATSSAVQTAVDSAAGAAVSGYVAGDIAVTGGPFGSGGANTVFTFSGNSVRGDHSITVDGASLTGGTTDPAPTETQKGVVPRFWFAALKAMGVIDGTDPAFGAAPNGQYTVNSRDSLADYPSDTSIKELIHEAVVQEGQDWDSELLPLLGYEKIVTHLKP